jgi:hypothetical protein
MCEKRSGARAYQNPIGLISGKSTPTAVKNEVQSEKSVLFWWNLQASACGTASSQRPCAFKISSTTSRAAPCPPGR